MLYVVQRDVSDGRWVDFERTVFKDLAIRICEDQREAVALGHIGPALRFRVISRVEEVID